MSTRTKVVDHLRRSRGLARVMANTGRMLKWSNVEHYVEMERKRGRQLRAILGATGAAEE